MHGHHLGRRRGPVEEEKTMRIARLAVALTFLMSTAARAQSAPAHKPDFGSFRFMVGSWSCRTTRDPDAAMIGKTLPLVVEADPGGYWYVATSPHAKRYLTHDAATGSWVSTALTTTGESYADRSTGWSGDSVVFKDAFASDGSALGSTTITKVSAREFTLRAVDPAPTGTETYEQSCIKST
jgi:hypothetical protein